jgi:hypothetical protein
MLLGRRCCIVTFAVVCFAQPPLSNDGSGPLAPLSRPRPPARASTRALATRHRKSAAMQQPRLRQAPRSRGRTTRRSWTLRSRTSRASWRSSARGWRSRRSASRCARRCVQSTAVWPRCWAPSRAPERNPSQGGPLSPARRPSLSATIHGRAKPCACVRARIAASRLRTHVNGTSPRARSL